MEKLNNESKSSQIFSFLADKVHWIATLVLLLGFIFMAIDKNGTSGGKSFHQITVAPILLLIGYSLFIFVVMRRKNK
jgi:cytochrome b561